MIGTTSIAGRGARLSPEDRVDGAVFGGGRYEMTPGHAMKDDEAPRVNMVFNVAAYLHPTPTGPKSGSRAKRRVMSIDRDRCAT